LGNQVYFKVKDKGVKSMLPKIQEAVTELKSFKESLEEIRVSL
jgi:hypothetical protein